MKGMNSRKHLFDVQSANAKSSLVMASSGHKDADGADRRGKLVVTDRKPVMFASLVAAPT